MRITKAVFFLAFLTLTYLLFDAVSRIDFAATKNNALTEKIKRKIEEMENIDSVKFKAKSEIDLNRRLHSKEAATSVRNFGLLSGLLLAQLFFLSVISKRKRSK